MILDPNRPRPARFTFWTWMRIASHAVRMPGSLEVAMLDDRPQTAAEVDELWIDSIGG